jgi:molecular chaperone DnaJ
MVEDDGLARLFSRTGRANGGFYVTLRRRLTRRRNRSRQSCLLALLLRAPAATPPQEMLRMHPASRADAYAALGLEPGATASEIKRAFRRLAMKWHPDRNRDHGAVDRFRQIKAAHDYLESEEPDDASTPPARPEPAPSEPAPERGPDQRELLWLDIEEAIFGGVHVLELERAQPCAACAGTGRVALRFSRLCARCFGSGRMFFEGGLKPCEACSGKGFASELECDECAGTGQHRAARRVRVTVPPGMWAGRTLRLAGSAAPAGDLPPGDLLLEARLRPHALFQVEGDALRVSVPVPLFELLAGGPVKVPVPGGAESVEVAPCTGVETRLSLDGQGLPRRTGKRGALEVVLQPVLPEALGKPDLEALQALVKKLAAREGKVYPELAAWRKRWIEGAGKKAKASRKKHG